MQRRRFLISGLLTAAVAGGTSLPLAISNGFLVSKDAQAVTLDELLTNSADRGKAVFGSTEVSSKSFKALPQWARVLKRMQIDMPALRNCTETGDCEQEVFKAWRRIIKDARPLSHARKLFEVNRYFNRWPYKFDQEIYGRSEFWASPIEFMRRSGDCEDFAIAKYFALRQLGIRNDRMRIVIIWDDIRGLGHAVLAVYEKNDILILDSLSDVILSHWKYKHYVPQYSMNETTRWAHVKV